MATNTPLAPKLVLSDDQAWHHARRLCLAPTGEIADRIRAQGVDAWVKQQLNPGSIPDVAYQAERARFMPFYGMKYQDFYTPARPLNANYGLYASIARAGVIHEGWRSERYLQTSMMHLWLDHFSVNAGKAPVGIMDYVNTLRANALGKFSTLLQEVYGGRCMQEYLDGQVNTKASPNQNLARELHELHTVGVNGGYTQDDVIAVSRLLSGVGFNATTGTVIYTPARHDSQPVRAMGWSSANNASTSDGIAATVNSYLNYLAMRPATARFVASKIIRWFIGDDSLPALESRLASIYLSSGTNIAPMLRALFATPEFKNSTGHRYRRPQQQAMATLALANPTITKAPAYPDVNYFNQSLNRLSNAFHYPFNWTFPDGYPQKSSYWMSLSAYDGQLLLTTTAYELLNPAVYPNFSTPDYMKRFGVAPTDTYAVAIPRMFRFITGHEPDATSVLNVARVWANVSTVSLSTVVNSSRIAYGFQAILASPYFQVL